MKDKDNEKTHLYSQDDAALDDALKAYEKTVSLPEKKKSFSFGKLAAVLCVFVAVAAVVALAVYFVLSAKAYPGVVVRKSDGKYALAGKKLVDLNFDIEKSDSSYENSTFAFCDRQNNLYALLTDKCKSSDDVKLVKENFGGEFFAVWESRVVYLDGGKLCCYDFSDSSVILENVSRVFHCRGSQKLICLTADNKLYSSDPEASELLVSDVKRVEYHSDGKSMNLLVTSGNGVYFCDETAQVTLLGDSSVRWICGAEDEAWDNVYFLKKSAEKRRLNIEFTDEYARSDSEMKEPVSSDFKVSLVFGLIQYVDPAEYRSAYIEYQKKLSRDNVREYVKNFKTQVDCYDVFCINDSGIVPLKTKALEDEILFFSKSGKPQVMLGDLTATAVKPEVSELVGKMKRVSSQEDFDEMMMKIIRDKNYSSLIVSSAEGEKKLSVETALDFDSADFSRNGEAILLEKSGNFSLKKIGEASLENVFENVRSDKHFFEDNRLIFSDENGEVFCVDFLNGFEKTSVAADVSEIERLPDGSFLLKVKTGDVFECRIYKNGETVSLAKNCVDFLLVSETEFFYVSKNAVYCNYDGKLFVHKSILEIMK